MRWVHRCVTRWRLRQTRRTMRLMLAQIQVENRARERAIFEARRDRALLAIAGNDRALTAIAAEHRRPA